MGRYNLGCGHRRLDGWINVDIEETEATDLVADLTEVRDIPADSASGIFSNAFFEHLPRDKRVGHLESVRRALASDGFVCYLGLPNFRAIAELYLNGGPGTIAPVFNLYNAYWYTHGAPEIVAPHAYSEQLHKSLFDAEELDELLSGAGFPAFTSFSYAHPGDPVAISLGFYATASQKPVGELEREARALLAEFDGDFLDLSSALFTDGTSRSALGARVMAIPERTGLRRIARVVAIRLWLL
jgi:predicted SAM-dependent methyltransferase